MAEENTMVAIIIKRLDQRVYVKIVSRATNTVRDSFYATQNL